MAQQAATVGAATRSTPTTEVGHGRRSGGSPMWIALGLTAVAAALHGWGVSQGETHYYYAAAVRSMSTDWHAFLYGALDPNGFITVDKLPGAFWVQALFVRVLGFRTWVLSLPQAIAATATVPLLYGTVRRWAGARAAAIAAAVFVVSPVTVAVARVNIPDTLLVFLLVAAAYAMTRALDGGVGWLLGSAALVGFGFQVKMLQALFVVPILLLLCLIDNGIPLRRRVGRAAAFLGVMVAVASWWPVLVAATPADSRPYLDGSRHNTVWELLFVYNGLGRVAGTGDSPLSAMAVAFGGSPGPLRLFNTQLGGQISWLLPAALLALVVAVIARRRMPDAVLPATGWLLWGGWLFVAAAALCLARGIHPYYAVMLAPAVAALVGSGADLMWTAWSRRDRLGWLLPATLLATCGWALALVYRTPPAPAWLAPTIAAATLAALALALALVAVRRTAGASPTWLRTTAAVAALVAVCVGPATWALATPALARHSFHTVNPVAGPEVTEVLFGSRDSGRVLERLLGMPPGSVRGPAPTVLPGLAVDRKLVAYLERHRGGARYLFATAEASSAAPYLVEGLDVLPMGGFTAAAPAPTTDQLARLTAAGELRYVLTPPMSGIPGAAGLRYDWVAANCTPVDPAAHGGGGGGTTLFDCRPVDGS